MTPATLEVRLAAEDLAVVCNVRAVRSWCEVSAIRG
jgi:hypothetical protein